LYDKDSIDQVKNLIDNKIGDAGRLEHILSMMHRNKALYESDKRYLKKILKEKTGIDFVQPEGVNHNDDLRLQPNEDHVDTAVVNTGNSVDITGSVERGMTVQNAVTRSPSKAWYLLPIFLGVLGGTISWACLRKSHPAQARRTLVVGVGIFALFIIMIGIGMSLDDGPTETFVNVGHNTTDSSNEKNGTTKADRAVLFDNMVSSIKKLSDHVCPSAKGMSSAQCTQQFLFMASHIREQYGELNTLELIDGKIPVSKCNSLLDLHMPNSDAIYGLDLLTTDALSDEMVEETVLAIDGFSDFWVETVHGSCFDTNGNPNTTYAKILEQYRIDNELRHKLKQDALDELFKLCPYQDGSFRGSSLHEHCTRQLMSAGSSISNVAERPIEEIDCESVDYNLYSSTGKYYGYSDLLPADLSDEEFRQRQTLILLENSDSFDHPDITYERLLPLVSAIDKFYLFWDRIIDQECPDLDRRSNLRPYDSAGIGPEAGPDKHMDSVKAGIQPSPDTADSDGQDQAAKNNTFPQTNIGQTTKNADFWRTLDSCKSEQDLSEDYDPNTVEGRIISESITSSFTECLAKSNLSVDDFDDEPWIEFTEAVDDHKDALTQFCLIYRSSDQCERETLYLEYSMAQHLGRMLAGQCNGAVVELERMYNTLYLFDGDWSELEDDVFFDRLTRLHLEEHGLSSIHYEHVRDMVETQEKMLNLWEDRIAERCYHGEDPRCDRLFITEYFDHTVSNTGLEGIEYDSCVENFDHCNDRYQGWKKGFTLCIDNPDPKVMCQRLTDVHTEQFDYWVDKLDITVDHDLCVSNHLECTDEYGGWDKAVVMCLHDMNMDHLHPCERLFDTGTVNYWTDGRGLGMEQCVENYDSCYTLHGDWHKGLVGCLDGK